MVWWHQVSPWPYRLTLKLIHCVHTLTFMHIHHSGQYQSQRTTLCLAPNYRFFHTSPQGAFKWTEIMPVFCLADHQDSFISHGSCSTHEAKAESSYTVAWELLCRNGRNFRRSIILTAPLKLVTVHITPWCLGACMCHAIHILCPVYGNIYSYSLTQGVFVHPGAISIFIQGSWVLVCSVCVDEQRSMCVCRLGSRLCLNYCDAEESALPWSRHGSRSCGSPVALRKSESKRLMFELCYSEGDVSFPQPPVTPPCSLRLQ